MVVQLVNMLVGPILFCVALVVTAAVIFPYLLHSLFIVSCY
jgi:hypothetical protein